MARVGVDIDEVLFPWYAEAHAACEQTGITNGVTPTSYAPYKEYGCTRDEWLAALDEARTQRMYHRPPIPGAAAALWELRFAGHSIHLVTARGQFHPSIRSDTVEWLTAWNFPYDALTFTPDKSTVRCDYFIDDRVQHLAEVAQHGEMPSGSLFLVDHPTNRVDRDAYWYTRIGHIREAVEYILTAERAESDPATMGGYCCDLCRRQERE